jgi:hypothetical protein
MRGALELKAIESAELKALSSASQRATAAEGVTPILYDWAPIAAIAAKDDSQGASAFCEHPWNEMS